MQKLRIDLPKHRLFLQLRVAKRRKTVLEEALIPTVSDVKKKYRKGSLISRYFRHVFEHKKIKKVLAASFAAVVVGTSAMPHTTVQAQGVEVEPVVEVENTLKTEKGIQYPVDKYMISQGFGFFHPGIDLASKLGNPVKPTKAGKVVYAGFSPLGYGNMVVIDHGNGLESLYAHLSKIEVEEGQEVKMDTEIGQVGKTGRATGSHLHLEIRDHGRALNPYTVLSR